MRLYSSLNVYELQDVFGDFNDSDYNYSSEFPTDVGSSAVCKSTQWVSATLKFWLLLLILIFSFLGNVWLLWQIILSRFKKVCHVLLCGLCCNAFVGCCYILCYILEKFAGVLSTWFCQLETCLQGFYIIFGIFMVCCLCIDTWVAIWFPAFKTSNPVKTGLLCCCAAAVSALLISVPKASMIGVLQVSSKSLNTADSISIQTCYMLQGENTQSTLRTFNTATTALGFFLPLLILLCFYGMCLWKLMHSKFRARLSAMRTMVCIIACFLLLCGPVHCALLYDTLLRQGLVTDSCTARSWVDLLLSILECLLGLFIVAIPLIYGLFNSRLRRKLCGACMSV
ncbi:G protein-coupled receptor [Harp seal herpesvirus]|uniref:G protein-coupled receptor n=1 Tax=phocid gammaherpesvirus 3 TaxID=2560643 RepID=A0A0R5YDA6_9GAMA|nr:G protein-coupled receptor [Harp seal herpesvirus]AJG43001.1 G protein-coupled receptor [Harp seal herpesvirus]